MAESTHQGEGDADHRMSWVGSQGLTLAAQVKVGALQAFVAETTHISIAIVAFDTVVRVANTVTADVLRR